MQPTSQQLLLHLSETQRLVVDPDDIYYLEASGHNTIVRRRRRHRLRRPIHETPDLGQTPRRTIPSS